MPEVALPTFLKTATLLARDLDERLGRVSSTKLLAPASLGRWARLLLLIVNPARDIQHVGGYSPGDRDHAQDLRHRRQLRPLLRRGSSSHGPDGRLAALTPRRAADFRPGLRMATRCWPPPSLPSEGCVSSLCLFRHDRSRRRHSRFADGSKSGGWLVGFSLRPGLLSGSDAWPVGRGGDCFVQSRGDHAR